MRQRNISRTDRPEKHNESLTKTGRTPPLPSSHSLSASLVPKELEREAALFAKTAELLDTPGPGRDMALRMRALGLKLRQERELCGKTRAQLAEETHFDAKFLLHLETGILMPEDIVRYVLEKVAHAVECGQPNTIETELDEFDMGGFNMEDLLPN